MAVWCKWCLVCSGGKVGDTGELTRHHGEWGVTHHTQAPPQTSLPISILLFNSTYFYLIHFIFSFLLYSSLVFLTSLSSFFPMPSLIFFALFLVIFNVLLSQCLVIYRLESPNPLTEALGKRRKSVLQWSIHILRTKRIAQSV
jgi:hypothetical protein